MGIGNVGTRIASSACILLRKIVTRPIFKSRVPSSCYCILSVKIFRSGICFGRLPAGRTYGNAARIARHGKRERQKGQDADVHAQALRESACEKTRLRFMCHIRCSTGSLPDQQQQLLTEGRVSQVGIQTIGGEKCRI